MPRTASAGRKSTKKTPKPGSLEAKIQAAVEALETREAESVIITPEPEPETAVVQVDSETMQRVENAYVRMGITAEEVAAYPIVTTQFKDIGGVDGVVAYLRGSDDKVAREVLRNYDAISRSQTKAAIPFEAYCVAARVSKKKFFQVLMGEVCDQSDTVSTLLAASAHPEIVQKTIAIAKSDAFGANEARSILHKHRGFLPTPKTQQVNIHGNVNQDNRQDNSKNVIIPLGDLAIGVRKISKATDRFNAARIVRSETTDAEVPDENQEYIGPDDAYDTDVDE